LYGFDILFQGELVGAIDLRVEDPKEAEIGYWVSEKAQGRGIVSRSAGALVRFSFVDLGLNLVVIALRTTSRAARSPSGSVSPSRRRFAGERCEARISWSTRCSGRSGGDRGLIFAGALNNVAIVTKRHRMGRDHHALSMAMERR
jgi:hypothetical protein